MAQEPQGPQAPRGVWAFPHDHGILEATRPHSKSAPSPRPNTAAQRAPDRQHPGTTRALLLTAGQGSLGSATVGGISRGTQRLPSAWILFSSLKDPAARDRTRAADVTSTSLAAGPLRREDRKTTEFACPKPPRHFSSLPGTRKGRSIMRPGAFPWAPSMLKLSSGTGSRIFENAPVPGMCPSQSAGRERAPDPGPPWGFPSRPQLRGQGPSLPQSWPNLTFCAHKRRSEPLREAGSAEAQTVGHRYMTGRSILGNRPMRSGVLASLKPGQAAGWKPRVGLELVETKAGCIWQPGAQLHLP